MHYALAAFMVAMPLAVCGCSSSKASTDGGAKMLKINGNHRISSNETKGDGTVVNTTVDLGDIDSDKSNTTVKVDFDNDSDGKVMVEWGQEDWGKLKTIVGEDSFEVQDTRKNKSGRQHITKTLSLRNFHAINAKTAVWVEYEQGSDYKVVYEGREKYLDELKFKVENGVLVIDEARKSSKTFNGNEHFTLHITAPHIDNLKVSGVLNFEAKRIKESKMSVEVNGVYNSDIDLLECDTYEVRNSGVMNSDGKVKAKTANITTSGVDNSDINYEVDELRMKVSGVSNADVSVKGGKVNVDCTGVGNTTLDLDCQELQMKASGYLNVELKGVADKVDISGSGVSNVTQKELNNF